MWLDRAAAGRVRRGGAAGFVMPALHPRVPTDPRRRPSAAPWRRPRTRPPRRPRDRARISGTTVVGALRLGAFVGHGPWSGAVLPLP